MRERASSTSLQQHHRVQHVYALDVEALSDRLGVSQQELVDGIAKEHSHVALQAMLESAAAHDDDSSSCEDDDENDVAICRQACLLLLPSKAAHHCTESKRERFAPLRLLEDGHTVLEHALHALFQPKILSHVVVCVPASLRGTDARGTVAKIASRLGASANVRVQVLDADEADGELHALQCAAKCFPDTSQQQLTSSTKPNSSNSSGLLVLNCDRIFDAPTIRMMAVSARSSAQSLNILDRMVRVRALVDLDVELMSDNNNDSEETDSHFAGIFAFMGDAAATAAVLEQRSARTPQQTSQCSTLNDFVRSMSSAVDKHKDDQCMSPLAVVEKVVASDYCSWRRMDRAHDVKEEQPIERHSTRAFHAQHITNSSSGSKNRIDARSHRFSLSPTSASFKQQPHTTRRASACAYVEFPRERHLLAAHGYQGFKVDTKLAAAREPELASRQLKGQSTSEAKPLLGDRRSRSYSESSQYLERSVTEATTLTEADLDALLDAKNRAFLFQIGPDTALPLDSSEATTSTGQDRQRAQDVSDDDGVFLALPDVASPDDSVDQNAHVSDPFAYGLNHQQQQGTRRRRSVKLPSAVQEIKVEAIVLPPSARVRRGSAVAVNVVVKTQVPIIGYAILVTAVIAISSQGAVQDLLVGVPPLLKVFWRMTGASMAFAPLALRSLAQSNWHLPTLTPRKRALFALCGVSYAIYNATFIVALSITSVGHTYIFSNCHSLLMVLAKLVLGQPLGALELVGAAIGFSGGVITTMDHHSASQTTSLLRHGPSTLGDMIALTGAFAGVAYLMSAKRVRPTLGVFVFMWALVTTVAVLVLVVLLWNREALGILVSSTDATHGLFGWLHHLGIEAYVVLVGSFAGTMGFVTALKYFDPLVVSVTMLTEPIVATIIGIAIGVDQVPGPLTFLGGLAVVVGCTFVLLASHRTCTRVDVSDALEEPAAAAWKLSHHASSSSSSSRRRHSTVHARDLQQQQQQQMPALRVNYGSFP